VKVIVNDANILIDLVDLKLLPHFFQIECEFHTTELILEELLDEQQEALLPYIETGKLIVDLISEEDLGEIYTIRMTKPALSEQDCSAFFQARKDNAALITSDNTLRKFAKNQNLEVHGHLWVFDSLVDNQIIGGQRATQKLIELCEEVNPKLGLPENECQMRIKRWAKR
jgi:predicted nucleic acid-binding protein